MQMHRGVLQAISGNGPYPLLISSPDGGYWVQTGDHDVAKGEDGVWRAPEISTEHYIIQTDKTASVYGRYFRKQVRRWGVHGVGVQWG